MQIPIQRISKNSAIIRKHNRQITQKLKPIENKLKKRLLLFYNQNIKGSLTPIEILRPHYEKQVYNMILSTVLDSYSTGQNKVLDQIKDKVTDSLFLDVSIGTEGFGLDNVKEIVEQQNQQFWKTATRIKWREAEIQKPDLQIEAALIGYSAWVTYHSFNKAVMSKMQDVMTLNNPEQNRIAARTKGSRNIETLVSEEFRNFAGRVMFVTAGDSKVDPNICAPLDGEIFEADASGTPIPPLHNFCRCRLIPLMDLMI